MDNDYFQRYLIPIFVFIKKLSEIPDRIVLQKHQKRFSGGSSGVFLQTT